MNAAIEQSNFAMRVIAEEHQAWVIAENNKRKPNFDDLARLFINIVKPSVEGRPAYAYWACYNTYPKRVPGKQVRIMNSDHISPNKDKSYSLLMLSKRARPWELPHVVETEAKLNAIRVLLSSLIDSRRLLSKSIPDGEASS